MNNQKHRSGTAQSPTGSSNKENWIELLRSICILAVIFNHTCMTVVNNCSLQQAGVHGYLILNVLFLFVRFAVPCFVMITGYLLLNAQKELTWKKLCKYIFRMAAVLSTFGVGYAFLELFFETKVITIPMIFQSVLNTLEGHSWSHMWYLYTLIGLYLITPVLHAFFQNGDEHLQRIVLLGLFTGNCIIPTVNGIFNFEIENYMLLNVYVMYYMLGGYLKNHMSVFHHKEKQIYRLGAAALLISCITEFIGICSFGIRPPWNHGASNVITPLCALAVFLFIKNNAEKAERNKIISRTANIVGQYSFSMFLIHPVFINILYKMIGITPLNFSCVTAGVVIIFILITVISLTGSIFLKKLPVLRIWL